MPVRSHWCDECNVDRLTNQALRRHVAAKHLDVRPFQCQNCPLAFSYQSTLQKHNTQSCPALIQKQKAIGRSIECDRCNYETPIKNKMLMHQIYCAKRAGSNLLRCEQCKYVITKGAKAKERLTAHVFSNNISHRSTWMCDQCDQIYSAKGQLKTHIQSKHTATKIFTPYRQKVRACARCGARDLRHILTDHCTIASRKTTPQQMTLTCDLCEYSTKGSHRWGTLSSHILARHFPSLCKQYVCDHCDRRLLGREGRCLIIHLRRGCGRRERPRGPVWSRVAADIITTGVKVEVQVGDE